jgi:hypothetical protein
MPVAQEIRARIDKWDCIKLKKFCPSEVIVSRIKKPPAFQQIRD